VTIAFHPLAVDELEQAVIWYGDRDPGLGAELEVDVYAAIDIITPEFENCTGALGTLSPGVTAG
jgi:hypothetical protein